MVEHLEHFAIADGLQVPAQLPGDVLATCPPGQVAGLQFGDDPATVTAGPLVNHVDHGVTGQLGPDPPEVGRRLPAPEGDHGWQPCFVHTCLIDPQAHVTAVRPACPARWPRR